MKFAEPVAVVMVVVVQCRCLSSFSQRLLQGAIHSVIWASAEQSERCWKLYQAEVVVVVVGVVPSRSRRTCQDL